MAEDNPNLIPLPSIGESKTSKASSAAAPKAARSKLWMVVVGCIVAGIGLGVFVYQQSIAPAPTPSKRPTATPRVSAPPSPKVPEVSEVTPQSKEITFPKAGTVRLYFSGGGSGTIPGHLIRLTTTDGQSADLVMPASLPAGDLMVVHDTDIVVSAGQKVKIEPFDLGDLQRPSYGWIPPDSANKCGVTVKADYASKFAWAIQESSGEPIVSSQCWADWAPAGTVDLDFNDYAVLLSYVPSVATPTPSASVNPSVIPSTQATATPTPSRSPSASPVASKSPSPSPIASKSPSPVPSKSPTASKSPSPSPTIVASVTPTPTSSARVTMPEASSLPDAGIFEVTAGTMGVGLVFILLGILGLLLI